MNYRTFIEAQCRRHIYFLTFFIYISVKTNYIIIYKKKKKSRRNPHKLTDARIQTDRRSEVDSCTSQLCW